MKMSEPYLEWSDIKLNNELMRMTPCGKDNSEKVHIAKTGDFMLESKGKMIGIHFLAGHRGS